MLVVTQLVPSHVSFQFLAKFVQSVSTFHQVMGRKIRKRYFGQVRPAKIQRSLRSHCDIFSSGQRRMIRLRGCIGLFEFSLDAHVRRYVFSRCALNYIDQGPVVQN